MLQLSFSFPINTDLHIYLQVDFNSRNTVTAERQTFYCVPIPGENPWVKEISLSCHLPFLLDGSTVKHTFDHMVSQAPNLCGSIF